MKKLITTLWFSICIISVFGQKVNEQLYKAIVKNDSEKVAKLLKQNADPNYIISSGPWMKVNMLITAINNDNIEIVKLLISTKADVNWKDGFNTTALMYAAAKGNKDIVILLLDNGADINATDGQGNTVLTAAKESKNQDVIKLIEDRRQSRK